MSDSPERAVLDTNVLVSAALFGGRPGELLELVRSGDIQGVTSTFILHELRAVLSGPRFRVDAQRLEQFVGGLVAMMEVSIVGPPRASWVTDAEDDPIVETALAGRATLIVTGDRQLLQARVCGIEILTVSEMLTRLAR